MGLGVSIHQRLRENFDERNFRLISSFPIIGGGGGGGGCCFCISATIVALEAYHFRKIAP